MARVYVWNFRGKRNAWGHASMEVLGQYVAWWPMGPGRVSFKAHDDVFSAHPIGNRRLQDDIRDEGGHPNHTIPIDGLDESKIMTWWRRVSLSWGGGRALGPPSVPWSSLGWNCSRIVAAALKKGGGDKFASWHKSWNLVWTPNDVREYVRSVLQGMRRR